MNVPQELSQAARRALADKLYEKRKTGALEVERVVRAALAEASPLVDANAETANRDASGAAPRRAIFGLVSLLADEFATHESPNRRKGGLLGLAAVVVGLERGFGEAKREDDGADEEPDGSRTTAANQTKTRLERDTLRAAVPPVLAAFRDPDARVRYYACEAMYNIVKTARGGLLRLTESAGGRSDGGTADATLRDAANAGNAPSDAASFSFLRRLFDASCDLSADADADVQNAAHLLDGLVKDVVSETFEDVVSENQASDGSFDVGACLVSAITSRMETSSSRLSAHATYASSRDPYARQFLIGWIQILDATPQVDALSLLPEFFDGLLTMLSDPNREIRQQADGCLRTFLTQIKDHTSDRDENSADAAGGFPRRRVDVARLSATLERHTKSVDEFTRVTAVTWLREFIALAGREGGRGESDEANAKEKKLFRNSSASKLPKLKTAVSSGSVARVAEMTRAVLPCLSHAEVKVRDVAARAAEELLEATRAAAAAKTLDLDALLSALAACAGADSNGDGDGAFIFAGASPKEETNSTVPILSRDPARVDALAGEATRAEALRWYLALLETAPEETRARMLGVANEGGPSETQKTQETQTKTQSRLSDSLTSVFLNVSSDSDLATARATETLARLGEGSERAFDAVVRALARALFEDEAYNSAASNLAPGTSRGGGVGDFGSAQTTAEIFPEKVSPTFLRRRGSATIRRLCLVLGDARVVRRLAEVVAEMAAPILGDPSERGVNKYSYDDDEVLAFAANAAELLNAIALAAPECASLRRTLRGDDDAFAFKDMNETKGVQKDEGDNSRVDTSGDTSGEKSVGDISEKESLLRSLFPCWCHSPAATIGLCLLSGLDATAFFCAEHTASDETELSRDALVRLDRLVYLIETPPFAGARMRLLVPGTRPHLKRALMAVLALLPQSSAFKTLRDRLAGCAAVGDGTERAEVRGPGGAKTIDEFISPFAARAFRAARAAHARARRRRAARASPNETRTW